MRIEYDRRGSGPLLLCHPGGPGFSGREFGDFAGLDATRTLLLLHPRGTQESGPADSYDLDGYVADLEELRESLGEEQIDLLGFSHGGLVAAAYAAAYPDRVRKLVFASSLLAVSEDMTGEAERTLAAKSDEPWHPAAMEALLKEEQADYATPEDLAAIWNAMAPAYFSQWDERYRAAVTMKWLPIEPLKQFNDAIPDIREAARSITAPTLIITGRDDFICGPAAAAEAAASIPHAEVVLLEAAGHMTFLEQPVAFRNTVEAFLSS